MKHLTVLITLLVGAGAVAQDSLSLSGAITRALKNNYGIQITEADERIAEIQNSWGTAGLYPTLSASASATWVWNYNEQQDFERQRLDGGVSLNWLLFDGFGMYIRKDRLELFQDLSAGNTAVVIEETIQDIILAYYLVLLEREKLEVARSLMELSQDRYEYESERQQLGSMTTYEVLQAKNSWLEDKGRYLVQEVAYKNSIRDLNFLMADAPQKSWVFTEEFKVQPSDYDLFILQEKMLANNKNLKNQYINQSLLEKEVALQRSEWWPTLSASASYSNSETELTNEGLPAFNSNEYSYTGAVNLRWTLFDGGNRKRAVQIAKVDRETGLIQLENVRHALTNQLYNLYEIHLVRQELLNVAQEALETAELNLQISEEKYRSGAINSFNYRDVQLLYLNSAVNRLDAIYAYIDVDTALLRIIGGIISQYE